jgi:hypothetical protein
MLIKNSYIKILVSIIVTIVIVTTVKSMVRKDIYNKYHDIDQAYLETLK